VQLSGGKTVSAVVQLSAGKTVSAYDTSQFDAMWMTGKAAADLKNARENFLKDPITCKYNTFYGARLVAAWIHSDRMTAMIQMYELTRDKQYFDHLLELASTILHGRDDRRTDSTLLVDAFRGRVMPAWGEETIDNAWNHTSSVLMTGLYSYPMAAVARLVGENPALAASLTPAQHTLVREMVPALLQTYEAFTTARPGYDSDFVTQYNAPRAEYENYWREPTQGTWLLTEWRCEHAATIGYQQWSARTGWTLTTEQITEGKKHCIKAGQMAGYPLPHNQFHAFMPMLIELSRALDTEYYKAGLGPTQRLNAESMARQTLPLVIARGQHYSQNRVFSDCYDSSTGQRECLVWNYKDHDGPDVSDTGHANLDMRYRRVLWQNQPRLDALLAASASPAEFIDSNTRDRTLFANTFLHRVSRGDHLAESLKGEAASPIDDRDDATDGWVHLAEFDGRVFEGCARPALALYSETKGAPGTHRHLGIATHAALLSAKRFRP
jgi:hypothetical protein